ncbi:MAG: hypothetical protein AMJ73_04990 [candidate division Zixibacteria bacterium SM1_73]|nr:MAG: hypothetical protein AMJ73_04990 [candidate division Zixibacteria bacterium SM1_73]
MFLLHLFQPQIQEKIILALLPKFFHCNRFANQVEMGKRLICSICFTGLLIFVALFGCSSTQNRTEERAKERVIQFIRLMSGDRIEEAEKLLSRNRAQSEKMEFFLNTYDNPELKDTSIVIEIDDLTFARDDTNKAMVYITVRNEKLKFTKRASIYMKFEKGDWYIGE